MYNVQYNKGDWSTLEVDLSSNEGGREGAEGLAREAAVAFTRYPNHAAISDELRQLKAEIYKVLLKVVSGRRMLDLAELVLKRAST